MGLAHARYSVITDLKKKKTLQQQGQHSHTLSCPHRPGRQGPNGSRFLFLVHSLLLQRIFSKVCFLLSKENVLIIFICIYIYHI